MAEGSATWTNAVDRDWENDGNWNPAQHPADGHTATFDNVALDTPNANLPGGGLTINFIFTGYFALIVDDLLAGGAVGDLDISDGAVIQINSNANSITCAVGTVHVWLSITVAAGVEMIAGGILKAEGGIKLTADVAFIGDGTVDWVTSGEIEGSFDAAGNVVTHTDDGSAVLILTNTSDFDLGGDFAGSVEVDAGGNAVTAIADLTIGSWTLTAGTFDQAGYDLLVGGPITEVAGTHNTNGGEVSFAGDIAIAAGVTVPLRTGQWTHTAGDHNYAVGSTKQIRLTIAEGTSLTTTVNCGAYSLDGVGDFHVEHNFNLYAPTTGFWSYTGTLDGAGKVIVFSPGNEATPGADINIDCDFEWEMHGIPKTYTMDGSIILPPDKSCTLKQLIVGNLMTMDMNGHQLRCGDLTQGKAGANAGGVLLKLGSASHSWASLADGGVNAGNVSQLDNCLLEVRGGTLDFTSIGVTAHATIPPRILCTAGGEIVNTLGQTDNVIHAWGDGSVDGGNNDAHVEFNTHPYPGSRMAMGVG